MDEREKEREGERVAEDGEGGNTVMWYRILHGITLLMDRGWR